MPLKLVRRPRSPFWYMRGTVRRIRVDESTGTAERSFAEDIRAKREVELLTQSIHGRAATETFASAALSYLENGGAKRFLAPVVKHYGTARLTDINQDAIDRGARKVYPHGAPGTLDRQFYSVVSAVLTHAAKRGWCPRPIIERPKLPPGRVRWITIEEANRLIAASAPHLRPLVIFMLYTGARAGEALWLDWRNVDLDRAHVSFPKTKNGDARGVPLPARAVDALQRIKHRGGEVFRRPDGEPYARPRNANDTSAGTRIKTAFQAAVRRAELTDFSPHDCRHTYATWHYAANRDLSGLMRLGGWKSERMVLRYAHVNVADLKHTVDKLPGGELVHVEPQREKA